MRVEAPMATLGGPIAAAPRRREESPPAARLTVVAERLDLLRVGVREGNLLLTRLSVERIRLEFEVEPPPVQGPYAVDFGPEATAQRIVSFALRGVHSRGAAAPERAAEDRFARVRRAVEEGIRQAVELLEALGVGEEVMAGVREAVRLVREGLARFRPAPAASAPGARAGTPA